MKKRQSTIWYYVIVSIAVVILTILLDMRKITYRKYASWTILMNTFYLFITVAVSILLYIKILLQSKVSIKFSRIFNSTITILFILAINIIYRPLGFAWFMSTFTLTTVIFCLQLCAVIYDIIFRKK